MATINKENRNFIDVDFSFARHPLTNNISIKKNESAIKQSIMHLLTLKEGDVPFHPEIKSPIYRFMFDNFSIVSKVVLESEVKNYLRVYEPRFRVDSIIITYPSPNEIQCSISGLIVNLMEPITINVLIDRLR